MKRSVAGGLWRTDPNYKSALYLRNNVETSSIAVTPILHLSNGAQYVLPNVTLAAGGTGIIDINGALQSQGIAPFATLMGYVEVQYEWPWDALCATVRNVDVVHSELFNFGLGAPAPPGSAGPATPVEGLWWKQESNVTGFVALANLSPQSLNATVQTSDSAGNPLGEHSVTVPPHGASLVSLTELQSAPTAHGGVRVTYDGLVGDLVINGGLEDQSTGYSANIPFAISIPPANAPFPSYAELGLMAGAASPMMNFPAGTAFVPYSLARNVSSQPVSVTPTVWWMRGGAPHSITLPAVTVLPYHSADLDAALLIASAGLGNFNGSVNLVLDSAAPPGALILASGSVDLKNTYVFSVIPAAIKESVAKTLSYWSTGNGDDTMVTVWNPADGTQDLVFRLFFDGGHYAFPLHLAPGVTQTFNISEIIQSRIPDAEGNTVPASIHEGSAMLAGSVADNQHILVTMDAGTYNVQKATCGTYCITCNGAVSWWVAANPFYVPVGSNTALAFTSQYNTGAQYNLTSVGAWSSSATSIATVSAGSVNGVSAGAVTVYASDAQEPQYTSACYGTLLYCPIAQGVGQNAATTVGCPQSVKLVNITQLDLEAGLSSTENFPGFLSGFGIWTNLQVSDPNNSNWTGAAIKETVTQTSPPCAAASSMACDGQSLEFIVGQAPPNYTPFLEPVPKLSTNGFWDAHEFDANFDVLSKQKQGYSCSITCAQTYSCGGNQLTGGSFTVTKTATHGPKINGTSVTQVSGSEQ